MALIRQQVIDALVARLGAITLAGGYSREVGAKRVHHARRLPQQLATPAVVLLQGDEGVSSRVGDRYECSLPISIGFVDAYAGATPDVEALEFLADVQRAMQVEISLTVTRYSDAAAVPHVVRMLEVGNSINAGDPIDGKIYGEAQYEVIYQRSIHDPAKH